jgi:single-strand DNA-binding protein
VWRKQAENVSKYCTKGMQVCVEGRMQTRNYDAQDGTKRYVTEVIADNVEFLGSKNSNVQSSNDFADEPSNFNYSDMPSVPETDIPKEDPFKNFGSEVSLSDDDLPF